MSLETPRWSWMRRRPSILELIYGIVIAHLVVIVVVFTLSGDGGSHASTVREEVSLILLLAAMPFLTLGQKAVTALSLAGMLAMALATYLAFRHVPGPMLRFVVAALLCGWLVFGRFITSYAGMS